MLFVIGLGNPGSQYEGTRHNLGFEVVDTLARALNLTLKLQEGDFLIAMTEAAPHPLALVKPLTYMNNSGNAVAQLKAQYNVGLGQLLVLCDDIHLPLGTIRLRPRGSDGGHNGLYSIIYHLHSDRFPRLRLGIASESTPSNKGLLADYLLSQFSAEEKEEVRRMIKRAAQAVLTVAESGLETAMNQFNRKQH
jgi:PTH1 family peptidyl-tRNA hydrolase